MTLLAETTDGHAQPVPALLRRLARGLLLQAPRRPRAARRVRRRPDRHHRLPVAARCRPGCASATTTRPAQAAADFQDILGRDNYFLELMDHGLDIETRVRDGLLRLAKDLGSRCSPPTTPTTSRREDAPVARAPALRQLRHDDGHPGRRRPGSGSRSTATATTSSRRPRCASCGSTSTTCREACDNTLLIAERCDVEFTEGNGTYMPRFPVPGGRDRGLLVRQGGREGAAAPLPRRHPRRGPQAGRLRGRRHHPDGLPRLLPGRRRLHQLGQGQRHPGRPGPRLRRRLDGRLRHADHRPRPARARPDLRAVPQPRPRLDARLRHRLRRASARRGDPLRHREVRRRPGRR